MFNNTFTKGKSIIEKNDALTTNQPKYILLTKKLNNILTIKQLPCQK